MPGIVLGSEAITVNRREKSLFPQSFHSSVTEAELILRFQKDHGKQRQCKTALPGISLDCSSV